MYELGPTAGCPPSFRDQLKFKSNGSDCDRSELKEQQCLSETLSFTFKSESDLEVGQHEPRSMKLRDQYQDIGAKVCKSANGHGSGSDLEGKHFRENQPAGKVGVTH